MPGRCPYCQSEQGIKGGTTAPGKQRSRCHTPDCSQQSFLRDSADKGRSPQIKQQVIDLRRKGSGVRDTARGLGISPTTVLNELSKKGPPSQRCPPRERGPAPGPRRGRRRTCRRSRNRRDGEFGGPADGAAVALACPCSPDREGLGLGLGAAEGGGVLAGEDLAGALWPHALLYRSLGRLRAEPCARCPEPRYASDAANRAQASHVTHADQAAGAPNSRLFAIPPEARSRHGIVHQSLRVWLARVKQAIQICNTTWISSGSVNVMDHNLRLTLAQTTLAKKPHHSLNFGVRESGGPRRAAGIE